MERRAANEDERKSTNERGVLLGSGLVGGTGLFGVVLAGVAWFRGSSPEGIGTAWAEPLAPALGVATIVAMAALFWAVCRRRQAS